ncbi:MAG: M23 family metallopeptidase [Actinobacteria bacterium]|nr:MAG: M23 family metallopeptidase [Actinomycetota bacterium]
MLPTAVDGPRFAGRRRLHNGVPVLKRASVASLAALLLLAAASADAVSQGGPAGGATARAQALRIVVPGQAGAATPAVSAPTDQVLFSGGFTYGEDPTTHAPIVSTGSANASASTSSDVETDATAAAEVNNLNVFNGEVTATSIVAQAHATARTGVAKGDSTGTAVNGLVALGQSVSTGTVALADWGSLTAVSGGGSGSPATGYHGSVTALEIRLTADHGGLPAGTTILVGYAEVAAQAPPAAPPAAKPHKPKANVAPKTAAPEPAPGFPVRQPPLVTPKLTAGGYVFPVYGPSSFTDTFGAARSDVSGGWHHGDDIFAPLGAPILAVAAGTVFSVGWNKIGGNRLWLRDGQGNLFYYAHLSAFTPLAVNGNKINAGDVLGFVGNTGDAQGTPTHLHFEIHPVGLIGLGYDGAVNPTTYLLAWKHLQDVSFAGGDAWAPQHSLGNAPKPGAILLNVSDISSADGLVPGSLERVIRPVVVRGDNFSARP